MPAADEPSVAEVAADTADAAVEISADTAEAAADVTRGTFLGLWDHVVDVWTHGLLGVDVPHLLGAVLIFVGFLALRGLFCRFVLARLRVIAARTATQIDDHVLDALSPPLRFVPVVLGVFVAGRFLGLEGNEALGGAFASIVRSLIVFAIFWGLHAALGAVGQFSGALGRVLSPSLVRWLVKTVRVLVLFIGAAVILEIWGIAVGPLLAGLGLFGAAVALGAQDLFKNLIGGITVLAEKRFAPGEWIRVDGVVEGTVEEIGFRSTKVRRFDRAPVHVPNAVLSDAVVTNFSCMTHRRIFWTIGVTYGSSVDQLRVICDGIRAYIEGSDDFVRPPAAPCFVRVDAFGSSSIDIMIYCFTKTTDWGVWLEVKERFALAIKEVVEVKAGAGFAFPSRTVYLENAAEVFVPPQDAASA